MDIINDFTDILLNDIIREDNEKKSTMSAEQLFLVDLKRTSQQYGYTEAEVLLNGKRALNLGFTCKSRYLYERFRQLGGSDTILPDKIKSPFKQKGRFKIK